MRALDRMHAYLHARTQVRAQNARTDTTHLLVVTVITLIDSVTSASICGGNMHALGHTVVDSPTGDIPQQVRHQPMARSRMGSSRCLKQCSSLSPSCAIAPADATWRVGGRYLSLALAIAHIS